MIRLLSLSVALWLFVACAPVNHARHNSSAAIAHVVLLWMKPAWQGDYLAELKVATQTLSSIPGVITIEFGEPLPSDRAMVDDSFSLGVIFYFKDQTTLTAYTGHPEHQQFLKTYVAGKTEKLVIYDIQLNAAHEL